MARVKALAPSAPYTPVGRPSAALLVIHAAHIAMLHWTDKRPNPPTQRQIQDDTKRTLESWRELTALERQQEEWSVPHTNTIRKHVQCYLRWRRGMTADERGRLSKDQRAALTSERLHPDIHAASNLARLIDLLGPSDQVVVEGTEKTEFVRATIAVTRQIRSIKTLH